MVGPQGKEEREQLITPAPGAGAFRFSSPHQSVFAGLRTSLAVWASSSSFFSFPTMAMEAGTRRWSINTQVQHGFFCVSTKMTTQPEDHHHQRELSKGRKGQRCKVQGGAQTCRKAKPNQTQPKNKRKANFFFERKRKLFEIGWQKYILYIPGRAGQGIKRKKIQPIRPGALSLRDPPGAGNPPPTRPIQPAKKRKQLVKIQ